MNIRKRQKTEFGSYLVEQIKAAEMTQEEFYNAIGIKKPYFYDLLTLTPPPIDLQNRMLAVLDEKTGEDDSRRLRFYDLAAAGRNEIPADILDMIVGHQNQLSTIRTMLAALLVSKEIGE
ncbi:MAG: hypothetical protein IJN63_00230 [Clostridia bacterium]|nr:hypothetical protein [Clostridia bacterium]